MDTVEKIVNDAESRKYPPEMIKERANVLLDRLEEELKEAYEWHLDKDCQETLDNWNEAFSNFNQAIIALNWLSIS